MNLTALTDALYNARIDVISTKSEPRVVGIVQSFPWDDELKKWADIIDGPRFEIMQRAAKDAFDLVTRIRKTKAVKNFDFDDPAMKLAHTTYVGDRIVQLQETTRQEVTAAIRSVLDKGPIALPDLSKVVIQEISRKYAGYEKYRADRIARTETGIAYNHGSLHGYRQADIKFVQVLDGDEDAGCQDAQGSIWTLDHAARHPLQHPNCSRAFSPSFER